MRLGLRYCCENCRKHGVYVLQGDNVRYGEQYPHTEAGKKKRQQHRAERFSCHKCGHRSKSVFDKKRDRPVLFTRVPTVR